MLDKNSCMGCKACSQICSQNAISFVEDNESFWPSVDVSRCINCGLCEKVCPIHFNRFIDANRCVSKVGKSKDAEVLYKSSSGGAFTSIYTYCISQGYHVYGAKFDENLRVVTSFADNLEDCALFRKCKYVLSDMENVYQNIGNQLKDGDKVCFSGTPCQNAALINYLSQRHISDTKLLTVTFLCHGVPSQKLFDIYRNEYEKKQKSTMTSFSFRNKDGNPIDSRTAKVSFLNGHSYIKNIDNDAYLRGFYKRLFYRPACAKCIFARKDRVTDLTIFDAWNIEKIKDGYRSLDGISIVVAASAKGKDLLKIMDQYMDLEDLPIDWTLSSQRLFFQPTMMHKNRNLFFEMLPKSFSKAVFTSTPGAFAHKMYSKMPSRVKRIVRSVLKK